MLVFSNRDIKNKIYYLSKMLFIFFMLGLLTSCTCVSIKNQYSFSTNQLSSRTLENFNRTMFNFNYYILDYYVVRLIALTWRDYVPISIRHSIINFLTNLEEPTSMINNFLRGNFYQGVIHFNRFFLNSIFGIAGLIDVASMTNPKLAKQEFRRFGGTLGYYQVGYGPYIVLPCYGSFTLREDGGDLIDKTYPMLSYLSFWMSIGKWILEGIEKRALLLDFDIFLQNSSDPYLMVKEAYFQNKNFKAQKKSTLTSTVDFNATLIEKNLDSID